LPIQMAWKSGDVSAQRREMVAYSVVMAGSAQAAIQSEGRASFQ
jgi:hypothetical protein